MRIAGSALRAVLAALMTSACREAPASRATSAVTSPSTPVPDAADSTWVPDSTAVLAHEFYSGLAAPTRSVVADTPSWVATWAQVQVARPRPAVDFAVSRVLVVALGERPTGGFDVGIDSAVRSSAGTVVYVRAVAPGRTCIVTDAFTQPVQLVLLAGAKGPITFQDDSVVRACP